MVTSKTKNENYFSYLLTEIIMVFCVTFLATAIFVFYFAMKSSSKNNNDLMDYFISNPFLFALICLIPVFFSVVILVKLRKRKYIIGFEFDDNTKIVKLLYRGIRKKPTQFIKIIEKDLNYDSFYEKGFLFVFGYKGIRIQDKSKNIKLDFVSNNFIWENQPREKLAFLEKMEKITENFKKNPPKTN